MDQGKYRFSADETRVADLPVPINLYSEIKKGNVEFLLEAFIARKGILQREIRKGSHPENVVRWQACVLALDAACHFLNKQKV